MKKIIKKIKGFTLTEVLIAIAILGILLAIVYVSLTSSRDRAADKAIQSNLSGIIGISAIIYSQDNTYGSDFCTNPKVVAQIELAKSAAGVTVIKNDLDWPGSPAWAVCHVDADGDSWAISVPLKSNPKDSWCVDSTGKLVQLIGDIQAAAALIPDNVDGHLNANQVSCSN